MTGRESSDALLAAIRAKCRDCCGGSVNEVRRCGMKTECALWPYRMEEKKTRKMINGRAKLFDAVQIKMEVV